MLQVNNIKTLKKCRRKDGKMKWKLCRFCKAPGGNNSNYLIWRKTFKGFGFGAKRNRLFSRAHDQTSNTVTGTQTLLKIKKEARFKFYPAFGSLDHTGLHCYGQDSTEMFSLRLHHNIFQMSILTKEQLSCTLLPKKKKNVDKEILLVSTPVTTIKFLYKTIHHIFTDWNWSS